MMLLQLHWFSKLLWAFALSVPLARNPLPPHSHLVHCLTSFRSLPESHFLWEAFCDRSPPSSRHPIFIFLRPQSLLTVQTYLIHLSVYLLSVSFRLLPSMSHSLLYPSYPEQCLDSRKLYKTSDEWKSNSFSRSDGLAVSSRMVFLCNDYIPPPPPPICSPTWWTQLKTPHLSEKHGSR